MRKYIFATLLSLFSINLAFAAAKLTIINNFNTNIKVQTEQHSDLIKKPDPAAFPLTISVGNSKELHVKLSKKDPASEFYIRITSTKTKYPYSTYSAFFGVEFQGKKAIEVHGYQSFGMAFSYPLSAQKTAQITFCTHAYYMSHGNCN